MGLRTAAAFCAVFLVLGCSTIGRPFHSDTDTLSQLIVGQTTPDDAVRVLGAEPYIRQNLPDGTLAWHWQSIAAGAYVGVTDNRLLVLQFKKSDSDSTWRFARVLHSQNVVLPSDMPSGTTVN